jgi:putative nucleotidyltransferase with HDIG domain
VSKALGEGDNGGIGRWDWARARIVLIGLLFVAALTALLVIPILPTGKVTYQVGDVVRADIRAPRRLEYESEIETELERDRAAAAVDDIYDLPETRVARQQITRAQEILAYITSVRADVYATPEQKVAMIEAIPDPELRHYLTPESIRRLLAVSEQRWSQLREEVVRVLDQAMRTSIRDEDLDRVRGRVHTLVDIRRLDDEEVAIVSNLVRGLLVPNTFVNVEATEAARQAARDAVQPTIRTYQSDEIVLREGDIVSAPDLEALEALGLLESEFGWRQIVGVLVLALLVTVILGLALVRYQPGLLVGRSRDVALVGLLIILFVLLAKLMLPGRAVLPYLYPVAALSMLATVLLNAELAIVASLIVAILAGQIAANSLELAVYAAVGSIIAALTLRKVERVNAFFRAGVYVGLANVVVVLMFRLPDETTDLVGIMTLTVVGLVNGALSASLTLAIFFILGNLFDITTSLKLLELSQPSHPLQRRLLLKAPGTYHHSLVIASLAEQAAEAIGANALLTRVGAIYHDIGKTVRPQFFTENQLDGVNPHDRLDPYTSADIIRGHVTDGLDLAKRNRLPSDVRAFIAEHHGDGFISFMYQRAVEEAGGDASTVDENRFRYIGPKPQSKESALLMLADGVEAITKSKNPKTGEDLEQIVNKAIKFRAEQGQLNDSGLTLNDLEVIRRSFIDTLKGQYHTRIEYPEPAKAESEKKVEATAEAPMARSVDERRSREKDYSTSFSQAFPGPKQPTQEEQESRA